MYLESVLFALASVQSSSTGFDQPIGIIGTRFDLVEACTSTPGQPTYFALDAACREYVVGVVDTYQIMVAVGAAKRCLPETMTAGTLREVVANRVKRGVDDDRTPAVTIVLRALREEYGCAVVPPPSTPN